MYANAFILIELRMEYCVHFYQQQDQHVSVADALDTRDAFLILTLLKELFQGVELGLQSLSVQQKGENRHKILQEWK